ncbi:MAG: hypothetical protein F4W90_00185 [Gammaproteobacteria bacterium]|nr:hypothetical protein [Gammaproteobacteria bacterium]
MPAKKYPLRSVRVFLRAFSWLPLGLARSLGWGLAGLAWVLRTRARRTTWQNLTHCYPDLSQVARRELALRSLYHTAATIFEMPAVWSASHGRLHKWIKRVEGEDLLKKSLATGSTLFLLPHFGNWEFLTTYLHPITTYTCLYSPRRLYELENLINERRSRFGGDFLPLTPAGLRKLLRRIHEGAVIIVLPDQVPNEGRSTLSEFRGRPLRTGTLPHELLKRGQLTALTMVAKRCRGGFSIHIQEVADEIYAEDAVTSVKALDRAIEDVVSLDSAQYQWEYKRFRGVADIYQ